MGAESRPGQVRPFGQPVFQQFKDGLPGNNGVLGSGTGERRGSGQQGRIVNQGNPFVDRLIFLGDQRRGVRLPGDELSKIQRINTVFHTLDSLSSIAGAAEVTLQRGEDQHVTREEAGYAARRNDLYHVQAAIGILAYRSLDNSSIAMLLDTLNVLQHDEGNRFILTPEQNTILEQLTTVLGIDYDSQKTQYTFTVVNNFPDEPYVTSIVEAPIVVEGK